MADPGAFKRPLYPRSNINGPVPDGDDIVAVKRAISRMGFWAWQPFDDTYSDAFAMGGADGPGVQGFQQAYGLSATGNYGEATHNKLKSSKIPAGEPHAGESAFDQTAANLYQGYSKPNEVEEIRSLIVNFCEIGLANTWAWDYRQYRPVPLNVNPASPPDGDCSSSVIWAYDYANRRVSASVPDPAKQGWSGYGNTDLYEDDHPHVSGSYLVGDLAHYQGHVTLCIKKGSWDSSDWWSFGSEPPSRRKLSYRSDFRFVVRPPLC